MVAVFAATFFMLRFTRFGTHVFAVGGGQTAARLSGVRVVHVKLAVYVLAGFVSGIAGIVQTANAGQVGRLRGIELERPLGHHRSGDHRRHGPRPAVAAA